MFLRPDASDGARNAAAVTARMRAGNPEGVDGLRRLVWQAGPVGEGLKTYPDASCVRIPFQLIGREADADFCNGSVYADDPVFPFFFIQVFKRF